MKCDQTEARNMTKKHKPIDGERIKKAVREILLAVGEDVEREGLRETPDRVARMYAELLGGMREEPEKHLRSVFTENYEEIVLLRDVPFYSICEHHLMPFIGSAHVAYLPSGSVLGVSKLARIVDVFARRLQLQERLTNEIASVIMDKIDPVGVGVVVEAQHLCMMMRGVEKQNTSMITSAMLGNFRSTEATRLEFLQLIRS